MIPHKEPKAPKGSSKAGLPKAPKGYSTKAPKGDSYKEPKGSSKAGVLRKLTEKEPKAPKEPKGYSTKAPKGYSSYSTKAPKGDSYKEPKGFSTKAPKSIKEPKAPKGYSTKAPKGDSYKEPKGSSKAGVLRKLTEKEPKAPKEPKGYSTKAPKGFSTKAPKSIKEPKAPKGSSKAGAPKAPKGGGAFKEPKAPKGTSKDGVPKAPKGSSKAGLPKAPKGGGALKEPKAPKGSSKAGLPKAPKGSSKAGLPKAPKGSSKAGATKAPKGTSKPSSKAGTDPPILYDTVYPSPSPTRSPETADPPTANFTITDLRVTYIDTMAPATDEQTQEAINITCGLLEDGLNIKFNASATIDTCDGEFTAEGGYPLQITFEFDLTFVADTEEDLPAAGDVDQFLLYEEIIVDGVGNNIADGFLAEVDPTSPYVVGLHCNHAGMRWLLLNGVYSCCDLNVDFQVSRSIVLLYQTYIIGKRNI